VGGSSTREFGELDGFSFNQSVSTTPVKSNRTAAKATLFEVEDERSATLSFGLREMTADHLKMNLLGTDLVDIAQEASSLDALAVTLVSDEFIDLGKFDLFTTKISHGSVTGGPFVAGEEITGGTSAATGKVAWVGEGFIVLIDISGTFVAAEVLTGGTSAATASATSVKKENDIVLTDEAGAIRYALGIDYSIDIHYGYLRWLSGGAIAAAAAKVSADHPVVTGQEFHGLSQSLITRKIIFVTDRSDRGPRKRYTYHKVQMNMDGDMPLIGDGETVLKVTGTVLMDDTQPSGEEYYKVEVIDNA
jgi:hypothetical protein